MLTVRGRLDSYPCSRIGVVDLLFIHAPGLGCFDLRCIHAPGSGVDLMKEDVDR